MTVYTLLVKKCIMKADRDSQLTLQDSDTVRDDETTRYEDLHNIPTVGTSNYPALPDITVTVIVQEH